MFPAIPAHSCKFLAAVAHEGNHTSSKQLSFSEPRLPCKFSVDTREQYLSDESNCLTAGFGNYLARPLFRDRHNPDMSEAEATQLLHEALKVGDALGKRANFGCPQDGMGVAASVHIGRFGHEPR